LAPLDPAILGFRYPTLEFDYEDRDSILYALGVGAGRQGSELRFVYEGAKDGFATLPTQAVVAPAALLLRIGELLGVDETRMLHGEQRLRLDRPLPTAGHAVVEAHVAGLRDKGAGAIIDTEATVSFDGELCATAVFSSFIRDAGGFGGERGEGLKPPPVDRPPDIVLTEATSPVQAQIYRLSGDLNPLHVDPAFAAEAGFAAPILHGLSTYGFAARMALAELTGGDPAPVIGIDARFASPVVPGDRLRLELWKMAADTVYGRLSDEESGKVAVDPLLITLRA
jgi:3-hydroxyacyl-CoA dehydrogenase/3a,7a,12a-trihydroxy-5b-cholest-24-enoyl-CoA hydratase